MFAKNDVKNDGSNTVLSLSSIRFKSYHQAGYDRHKRVVRGESIIIVKNLEEN
jgi:hypothetical protein